MFEVSRMRSHFCSDHPRTPTVRRRLVAFPIAVCLLAGGALQENPPAAAQGSPAQVGTSQDPAERRPQDARSLGEQLRERLVPVNFPDLSRLEKAVAEEIGKTQEMLTTTLAQSEPNLQELLSLFGLLGRLYHAHDLVEPAIACYDNALRLSPNDLRWAYYQAVLAQEAGNLERADTLFNICTVLDSRYLATRVRFGQVLADRGDISTARRQLEIALALDPNCAAAHAELGQIALEQEEHAQAIEHLETALKMLPAATRLHYPLALAYKGLGNTDKAREHLARRGDVGARAPDPLMDEVRKLVTGLEVHLLRGRMAYEAGSFDGAAHEFQKAVEARPDSPRGYINLGSALAKMKRFDEAVEQYRTAARLDPTDGTVHFNIGSLLAFRGDFKGAAESLSEAVRLDPTDTVATRELAEALRKSGQPAQSLLHFARVREQAPLDGAARHGEARALVQLERYREAIQRLEEAREALPEDGDLAHSLARLLAASPNLVLRDGRRAVDLALQAFEAKSTVDRGTTVAMALAEVGECTKAADWLRIAIESSRKTDQEELARQLEATRQHYLDGPPCRHGVARTTAPSPGSGPEAAEAGGGSL